MKDDSIYLEHILECISRIEENASNRGQFFASHLLQDATLRNLQTLAESCQRLSQLNKDAHSHIPWRDISGFRNILVHNYLDIDFEQVWMIIERDLPLLKLAASQMLQRLSVEDD
jgi:uncharacterized protein with HEPN domain